MHSWKSIKYLYKIDYIDHFGSFAILTRSSVKHKVLRGHKISNVGKIVDI